MANFFFKTHKFSFEDIIQYGTKKGGPIDKFIKSKNIEAEHQKSEKDKILKKIKRDLRFSSYSTENILKKHFLTQKDLFNHFFEPNSIKKIAKFLLIANNYSFSEIFLPRQLKKSVAERYLESRAKKVTKNKKDKITKKLKRNQIVFEEYFRLLKFNFPTIMKKTCETKETIPNGDDNLETEDITDDEIILKRPRNYDYLTTISTENNTFKWSNNEIIALLNKNMITCVLNVKRNKFLNNHRTIYMYCDLDNCRKFIVHCFSDKVDIYSKGIFKLVYNGTSVSVTF